MTPDISLTANPLAALSHPDGVACCRHALHGPGFYFEATLGSWVAVTADAVREVLASPLCQVRPRHEPVPAALQSHELGQWFARLLRQRDDDWQSRHKPAVAAALAAVDLPAVHAACRSAATAARPGSGADLDALALSLPLGCMAELLGLAAGALDTHERQLQTLLAALRPEATPGMVSAGEAALRPLLGWVVQAAATPLSSALREALPDDASRTANILGLLVQTREATAALIAMLWHRLAGDAALRAQLSADTAHFPAWLTEVLRDEPPVQLTRRYVVVDGDIGGQQVRAGDGVLVWLATANLDAATHQLAFGAGRHRCPGAALAQTMAAAVAEASLDWTLDWPALLAAARLQPSANARWYCFSQWGRSV
ncbi:cytochrome P450 [Pseudogulbenkiania sp. MAI-1]|uniref:cytochrome P450 n=1 Tax=Pseudogulbenkiania sp. MAI-1 TaxID=990370 RepID=UPI00045E5AB4|nr:cytochrome P450 [Pseudogulbenkiania sp. MAI-1]